MKFPTWPSYHHKKPWVFFTWWYEDHVIKSTIDALIATQSLSFSMSSLQSYLVNQDKRNLISYMCSRWWSFVSKLISKFSFFPSLFKFKPALELVETFKPSTSTHSSSAWTWLSIQEKEYSKLHHLLHMYGSKFFYLGPWAQVVCGWALS